MSTSTRATHERWLHEITALPTAAGREHRVIDWIEGWVRARKGLRLRRDKAGNLFITRTGGRGRKPILITAHLDHPAFVVRRVDPDDRHVTLEFRGGVHPPYFDGAAIEIFDADDAIHVAKLLDLDVKAKPYKRVTARLSRKTTMLRSGDVGRWRLRGPLPRVEGDRFSTYACDDLAAVAAALACLDTLRRRRGAEHVGVLFTRAEEVGFVGALAACAEPSIPRGARLICLENSRSFAESPIGGGPILRVGDKISVFDPRLTNRIGDILTEHAKRHPSFAWQRKLMPGGSCEATAFSSFGFESTCVCLALGNYHNMQNIDGVLAGKRPARVGPEHISISDYHGLIELLVISARKLDTARIAPLRVKMEKLLRSHRGVLGR